MAPFNGYRRQPRARACRSHERAGFDLATLYLEQGRNAEVKVLADGMVPIFAAQDVHREATAALMLFQEAARREEMTAVFVRQLFAFLEAARMNPGLRFERK